MKKKKKQEKHPENQWPSKKNTDQTQNRVPPAEQQTTTQKIKGKHKKLKTKRVYLLLVLL